MIKSGTAVWSTHIPGTSTERDENRWVICDPLQPLVQPPIGIVNVRVRSPQRFVSLNRERKGEHGRVGRQVYRSPLISRVGRREDNSVAAGFTNAPVERTEQTKGFVEHSPDYRSVSQTIIPEINNARYFNLRMSSRVGVPSVPSASITSSLTRTRISGCWVNI